MSKLTITFKDDAAMDDFTSWLSDCGQVEFDCYLEDRGLDLLQLNFVDEENIDVT